MDQNINPEQKVKTEQKRVHKIGKFEYELTPGIGNDKDWVSFEEACQILTLKIDQVRKLSTAWEKKYDMADRVMKTFVPRQSVLDCLHQRNFHVAQDADHKPVQSEGEPSTFKPHEVHSPDPIPVGSGSQLSLLNQNEIKELVSFKNFATGFLAKQEEKITTLEAKNESITKDLMKEKDEKVIIKITNNNLKMFLSLAAGVIFLGGGVAGFFVYTTNKDNDRLYAEKHTAVSIITTLNAENSNLKTKDEMQRDEIEILKKQVPVIQNAEINAVKKD